MPVPSDVIRVSEMMGITIHINLDCISETDFMRTIDKVGGIQVLTESIRLASGKQMFAKRVLDILGALVGLVFTGILTVIVGPMIYFSDPGPIFFSQSRVGMNGRKFKIYKFRSMYQDAEARKKDLMEKNEMQGLMFKIEADPRIIGSGPDGTKHGIGWFIRKTSIDEFPQFWNVLKGEMSLVGTRPPTADEWEQYEAHHRARMSIRPGLTGLWQVSGRSDITDFEEVIALDMQYINNWTIYEDIKIILKTVGLLFSGGGAK
jgi:lipopolysaccharide/colanic/teichoic acid biosynthesis glycosyltransferase